MRIRNELLDTDNFVAALGPWVEDPQVQQQIVDKVNDDLLADVDLQGFIDKELPSGLTFLAGPAEDAIRNFVRTATERIVASDEFEKLYVEALRVTHASLMKVLTSRASTWIHTTKADVLCGGQDTSTVRSRRSASDETLVQSARCTDTPRPTVT